MNRIGADWSSGDPKLSAYFIPLSTVTSWPAPNTTNPDRRTWYIPYAVCIEILATAVTAVRFYNTWWTRVDRRINVDDVFIFIGWV